ncbi:MAG: phosphoribosylaminoimidazolecarboxamide formyltransferase [Planctomycetes bacterium DG_23]|nr:MAG: phosphoribosylaminoimidazolecarboxamide formyltransferase [Planctomycetes bacterium DG_23]
MQRIRRALISVSDKRGVVEFARGLAELDVEILSTGGTAKILRDGGIKVVDVSEYTEFPEILDGRVKTLHPKIHGGILAVRDNPGHRQAMERLEILPIDLVACNLYPFEATVAKEGTTLDEAIEQIDIGGPSMLRSAAKNYKFVAVVTEPEDYSKILEELKKSGGHLPEEMRFSLALKTFQKTARYDAAIVSYLASLGEEAFPAKLALALEKKLDLRYGENPHQKAALYLLSGANAGVAGAEKIQGKELSFNNFLDLNAAWDLAKEFSEPACVVIKHTNPCGAATSGSMTEAIGAAFSGDPVSAFGSVIGLNRPVDVGCAEEIAAQEFIEAIIAPDFSKEALEILTSKPKWGKNVRILKLEEPEKETSGAWDFKALSGGLLVQEKDDLLLDEDKLKVVTKRAPTQKEEADLRFAWAVCKHTKSNSIVLAKENTVVGVGAGQMSRVDSAKIAIRKAAGRVKGAVAASDAFFPFPDALEEMAGSGVTAVIQPGGALRDEEVIAAADERGLAMLFTGMRHFKH